MVGGTLFVSASARMAVPTMPVGHAKWQVVAWDGSMVGVGEIGSCRVVSASTQTSGCAIPHSRVSWSFQLAGSCAWSWADGWVIFATSVVFSAPLYQSTIFKICHGNPCIAPAGTAPTILAAFKTGDLPAIDALKTTPPLNGLIQVKQEALVVSKLLDPSVATCAKLPIRLWGFTV